MSIIAASWAAVRPGTNVRVGSKPEKLNASRCFLLFPQQRTSRPHNLVPIGGLVAFDHRSGSFCFLRPEFLRVNEAHRSRADKLQRFDHPPPHGWSGRTRGSKSDLKYSQPQCLLL